MGFSFTSWHTGWSKQSEIVNLGFFWGNLWVFNWRSSRTSRQVFGMVPEKPEVTKPVNLQRLGRTYVYAKGCYNTCYQTIDTVDLTWKFRLDKPLIHVGWKPWKNWNRTAPMLMFFWKCIFGQQICGPPFLKGNNARSMVGLPRRHTKESKKPRKPSKRWGCVKRSPVKTQSKNVNTNKQLHNYKHATFIII